MELWVGHLPNTVTESDITSTFSSLGMLLPCSSFPFPLLSLLSLLHPLHHPTLSSPLSSSHHPLRCHPLLHFTHFIHFLLHVINHSTLYSIPHLIYHFSSRPSMLSYTLLLSITRYPLCTRSRLSRSLHTVSGSCNQRLRRPHIPWRRLTSDSCSWRR